MTDKKKRRSLRIFHVRSSTPDDAPQFSKTPSPVDSRLPEPPEASPSTAGDGASPINRPRVLTKHHRTSVFGSLRSLQSLDEDDRVLLKSDSKASSVQGDGDSPGKSLFGDSVKKAAEVQVTGSSVFRKRTQYMVLTESHLIRFKSQSKASEMFPIIPPGGKPSQSRNTVASPISFTDMQSSAYMDITQGVPLDEVVAVYRIEDGRPYCTVEVAYLDERSRRASTLQLNLSGPREADAWMTAIREHSSVRRALFAKPYRQKTLEYLAGAVAREKDYDPLHFRVFRVVQRIPVRLAGTRPSNDDVAKNGSSTCYLVIGVNRIHFIPLPKTSGRSSSTSLSELEAPSSFGIVNLTSVKLRQDSDNFELYFRAPLRHPYLASLASYDSEQIALWIRYASEYLRPEWTVQPFVFDVPTSLEDAMDPPAFPIEDNCCFDRTLVAFCSALDVDPSRLFYSVDYHCEDAPCFRLLPAEGGATYSSMELLAVLRALRYNESFTSVSFANIDLGPLRSIYDPFGASDDSICGRTGNIVDIPGHSDLSVLQQELRALALKSRKLRRFDFTNCLPSLTDGKLSSGIPEAFTPLSKKMLTNVDWLTLNGIRLTDHDLDFLVDAASERQCHIRALELGECGLSVHDVDVLLSTIGIHDNTMESINISGTQGRFSPELFQRAIGTLSRIRRLNLTRIQRTAGPEPLIAPEIMLSWRLESLHLNGTPLNEQSVDTISAYLASSKSDLLKDLSINQCALTGKDLTIFFRAMTRQPGTARNIHVSASENRLGLWSSLLSKCIADDCAPKSITMRMIDFDKEYQFRELITAFSKNTTIRNLDISQASLPYDASMETCEALKELFAKNQTLEELDISGDVTHLDVARFGIGLNVALLGLEKNKALKMLRIEHQSLGLQGANTLAGVIEKNTCLTEIHCEHNDLNLQSFTVLVNAMKHNKTLLYLPGQEADRARSMEKVKEEFEALDKSNDTNNGRTDSLMLKSFHAITAKPLGMRHRRHSSALSTQSNNSFSQREVSDTMTALQDRWDAQIARLQQYLLRNYQIASGLTWEELDSKSIKDGLSNNRPATADSLARMLAKVNFEKPGGGLGIEIDDGDRSQDRAVHGAKRGYSTREERPIVFTLPED